MNNAINCIMKAGGLVKEEEYPYKGVDGTCKVMAANEMPTEEVAFLDHQELVGSIVG